MDKVRREPRWVISFLRALERTGEARAAAADAGIDHTTAYARRRAHADFAAAWQAALKAHCAAKARGEDEAIAALRSAPTPPLPPVAVQRVPPSPAEGRGPELVASGGRMKRAGHGRWSKAKEKIFFEELAATNNITRSAAAAGVSPNAVRARRLKHRLFRAKWDAVVENARATIDLYLVEESRKTFDPEELDTGDVEPKVSIDQAIRISQLGRGGGGGGRKAKQAEPDPFDEEQEEEDAPGDPELVADMVHRMVAKLRRLRERDMPENIAQGWQFDEAHDVMIPPGWVRSEPRAA